MLAHELKLPYPPLLLRVIGISAVYWLLLRVMYVFVVAGGLRPPEEGIDAALHPVWPSRILLVALTSLVVWFHRKLGHEHLLQANFGVPSAWFAAASLVAAGVSDLIVQALVRSF